eukprot:m51a1_g5819 hypothetical protein (297) ;mRNA; r:227173-229642
MASAHARCCAVALLLSIAASSSVEFSSAREFTAFTAKRAHWIDHELSRVSQSLFAAAGVVAEASVVGARADSTADVLALALHSTDQGTWLSDDRPGRVSEFYAVFGGGRDSPEVAAPLDPDCALNDTRAALCAQAAAACPPGLTPAVACEIRNGLWLSRALGLVVGSLGRSSLGLAPVSAYVSRWTLVRQLEGLEWGAVLQAHPTVYAGASTYPQAVLRTGGVAQWQRVLSNYTVWHSIDAVTDYLIASTVVASDTTRSFLSARVEMFHNGEHSADVAQAMLTITGILALRTHTFN